MANLLLEWLREKVIFEEKERWTRRDVEVCGELTNKISAFFHTSHSIQTFRLE